MFPTKAKLMTQQSLEILLAKNKRKGKMRHAAFLAHCKECPSCRAALEERVQQLDIENAKKRAKLFPLVDAGVEMAQLLKRVSDHGYRISADSAEGSQAGRFRRAGFGPRDPGGSC